MHWTVATQLTLFRMAALPFVFLAFIYHRVDIAFWIFIGAALTDFFDGFIARTFHQKTELGALLDPIADKLLLDTCYLMMTYGAEYYSVKVPPWLTVLVIFRDTFILTGALIFALFSNIRNFRPTKLGKFTSALQAVTMFFILAFETFHFSPSQLMPLFITTAGFTLLSGAQYLYRGILWVSNPEGTS